MNKHLAISSPPYSPVIKISKDQKVCQQAHNTLLRPLEKALFDIMELDSENRVCFYLNVINPATCEILEKIPGECTLTLENTGQKYQCQFSSDGRLVNHSDKDNPFIITLKQNLILYVQEVEDGVIKNAILQYKGDPFYEGTYQHNRPLDGQLTYKHLTHTCVTVVKSGKVTNEGRLFKDGELFYEGDVMHGYGHGFGEIKLANNTLTHGVFDHGCLKTGQLKIRYPNGNTFEGRAHLIGDAYQPLEGTMTFSVNQQTVSYIGTFSETGRPQTGSGTWVYPHSQLSGTFVNGHITHETTIIFPDKRMTGTPSQHQPFKGTINYTNGDTFEGTIGYTPDLETTPYQLHHGTYTFKDTSSYRGSFKDNKPYTGKGHWLSNEVHQNGDWIEGHLDTRQTDSQHTTRFESHPIEEKGMIGKSGKEGLFEISATNLTYQNPAIHKTGRVRYQDDIPKEAEEWMVDSNHGLSRTCYAPGTAPLSVIDGQPEPTGYVISRIDNKAEKTITLRIGQHNSGELQGNGIFIITPSGPDSTAQNIIIQGKFNKNIPDGIMLLTYPNGDRYIGPVDDTYKRQGKGTYIFNAEQAHHGAQVGNKDVGPVQSLFRATISHIPCFDSVKKDTVNVISIVNYVDNTPDTTHPVELIIDQEWYYHGDWLLKKSDSTDLEYIPHGTGTWLNLTTGDTLSGNFHHGKYMPSRKTGEKRAAEALPERHSKRHDSRSKIASEKDNGSFIDTTSIAKPPTTPRSRINLNDTFEESQEVSSARPDSERTSAPMDTT